MPKYARDFRETYNGGKISAATMIKQVYDRAKAESDKTKDPQRLAIRGIRALFALTKNTVHEKSFSIKTIYQHAEIDTLQTPTSGLWVWDDDHGCRIVGKAEGKRQYWIKDEFLTPLQQVLETTKDEHAN
ncbi:MAG: hypothetical protein ABIH70_07415 [Chloroflexota bacterium]